ncbi:MAG: DUF1003 domain-containing protein [Caulobacterales bacterium]
MNQAELDALKALRERARLRRHQKPIVVQKPDSFAQQAADWIASHVGSWGFVITQSVLLIGWLVYNASAAHPLDPFPFILLNLMLSFQAAYTAPIIMMSQNRQSEVDRRRGVLDFEVNQKAELEIETLHHKVDLLRETEIAQLTAAVARLTEMLEKKA